MTQKFVFLFHFLFVSSVVTLDQGSRDDRLLSNYVNGTKLTVSIDTDSTNSTATSNSDNSSHVSSAGDAADTSKPISTEYFPEERPFRVPDKKRGKFAVSGDCTFVPQGATQCGYLGSDCRSRCPSGPACQSTCACAQKCPDVVDCARPIKKYEKCMRKKLNSQADFKLDSDFRANMESFQCNLVECLTKNNCQPTSTCLSPDRDLKLPGNFTIQFPSGTRQQFLLANVDQARQKMATCSLDIIQKILAPRVEQCVKSTLSLGPSWKLPSVTADQLTKNLSALALARNTVYQQETALREITRQLSTEAGCSCQSTESRRLARHCIADKLIAAETNISQPGHSPYASALDAVDKFCDARDECSSRLNTECSNAYQQIPSAINACYDWSQPATELEILAPYLDCLARQEGFPFFSGNTDIVLFKTNTLRKLVNLMRDDLQVRTGKFSGNLTQFRCSSTDECNPNFALTSDMDQLEKKFKVVEVEKDKSYLLLPKDNIQFLRRKRDVDKRGACAQYNILKAKMDLQCSDPSDKPLSSAAPAGTSSQRQIETLLAAGESAFDEGVVGPTIIVKQNVFGLNHPFLKYQELLSINATPFRRLTNFGHS